MLFGYLPAKKKPIYLDTGIVKQPEKSENFALKRSKLRCFLIRPCHFENNLSAVVL